MRVRYRARALSDLEDIYRYLAPRSPSGAHNVLRVIHGAIDEIAEFPYSAVRTDDPNFRVKVLGRYRYKIFYRVLDSDEVVIVHIRHAARRPWRDLS